jgi:hypothetical protein
VTPGDYCLCGLGSETDATADGWIGVVTRAPTPTFIDLTAQLTAQPLVDPWDCAIDPTNGDILVADEGGNGSSTDGSIHRISVTGGLVTGAAAADRRRDEDAALPGHHARSLPGRARRP